MLQQTGATAFDTGAAGADFLLGYIPTRVEQARYRTLEETLASLRGLFEGRRVLDFGASYALSVCALLELGAAEAVGVEPDAERVRLGRELLARTDHGSRATLYQVADTRRLPFAAGSFDVVLANAVFEHIPQPREAYLREVWRVLRRGGFLVVNETPNKYLPKDYHTTGLWGVPWLPSAVARRYALRRGRFRPDAHWASSGWRGVGFYEIARGLGGPYRLYPERTRLRHRLLTRLGLPASLLDPYPTLIFQKL